MGSVRKFVKTNYKILRILWTLAVATSVIATVLTDVCQDESAKIDSARIKILGYDRDGNGVRDDLDSLIDFKIPDSPEKRAAYRYLAQAMQNQWTAFYENPQMTYEELLPYEIYILLGITLMHEVKAESDLNWKFFEVHLRNTRKRILFDDKIDRVFAGRILPGAIKLDKQYSSLVAKGMNTYNEILKFERENRKSGVI